MRLRPAACHTIEADCRPDCGRAGDRSSIITAIGWRCEARSLIIRRSAPTGTAPASASASGSGWALASASGWVTAWGLAWRVRGRDGWRGRRLARGGLTHDSGRERAHGHARHEEDEDNAEHGRTPPHRRSPSWVSSFGVRWWPLAPSVEARNAPRRILRTSRRARPRGTLHRRVPASASGKRTPWPTSDRSTQNGTASDASAAAPVPSRPRRSTVSDHPVPGEPAPGSMEGEVMAGVPQATRARRPGRPRRDRGHAVDPPGGVNIANADSIDIRQGGITRAEARDISVVQGGIAIARADRVSVGMGGIGLALGGEVDVTRGFARTVVARDAHRAARRARSSPAGPRSIARAAHWS